jgi:hypothetical protein
MEYKYQAFDVNSWRVLLPMGINIKQVVLQQESI